MSDTRDNKERDDFEAWWERGVASICGPHSSAGKALANAEERRGRGETVRFLMDDRRTLIVEGTPAGAQPQGESA